MPCYEVRTMSVEFKAKHLDLLKGALDELGWKYTTRNQTVIVPQWNMVLDLNNGKAEVDVAFQPRLNELKRAYSSAAIDRVTKKNRWARRSKTSTKGVMRRF